MGQREIARLKPMEIPEDFMLGMVAVEHLVREVGTRPRQVRWESRIDGLRYLLHGEG